MERKIAIVDGWIEKADDATGTVVAVVNTGNVKDLQGDTMVPGCWSKVLREKQSPAICWFHELKDIRGSVLELEELRPGDPRVPLNQSADGKSAGMYSGLRMKGQFEMETQDGRDAYVLVKNRRVRQWSVQFDLDEKGAEPDGKGGRNIKQVNTLYEISPVLVGASPGTATLALAAKDALSYLSSVNNVDSKDDEAENDGRTLAAVHELIHALGADDDSHKALVGMELDTVLKDAQVRKRMLFPDPTVKARFQMDDGKYPINDCADVADAWGLRGRSNTHSRAQVERHVRHAASELHCDGPWNDGKSHTPDAEASAPYVPALPPKVIGHIRAAAKLAAEKLKEEESNA